MTSLPASEVLRYLGNAAPTERLMALVASVSEEILGQIRPRSVHRRLPVEVEERAVHAAGFRLESRDLARHLRGCRAAYFLAATLGADADRLLRRYAALDLPRAAVWQAACAALMEGYLDQLTDALLAQEPGLNARPRFSPGYGDLDLSSQETMFALLDLKRRLGLTLTPAWMMLPEKSVTAILGLSDAPCASRGGCAVCAKTDCLNRRMP